MTRKEEGREGRTDIRRKKEHYLPSQLIEVERTFRSASKAEIVSSEQRHKFPPGSMLRRTLLLLALATPVDAFSAGPLRHAAPSSLLVRAATTTKTVSATTSPAATRPAAAATDEAKKTAPPTSSNAPQDNTKRTAAETEAATVFTRSNVQAAYYGGETWWEGAGMHDPAMATGQGYFQTYTDAKKTVATTPKPSRTTGTAPRELTGTPSNIQTTANGGSAWWDQPGTHDVRAATGHGYFQTYTDASIAAARGYTYQKE